MNESLHESRAQGKFSPFYLKKLILAALKITALGACVGVYFGRLFFGEHSVEVYADLSARCEQLRGEIRALNQANSRLQKEYFELKSIQGN